MILIKEVKFLPEADFIWSFRKEAYGNRLWELVDVHDQKSHQYFIYDSQNNVIGMFRVLRSDEFEKFELEEDTGELPERKNLGLGLEISRLCTRSDLRSGVRHIKKVVKFMTEYFLNNDVNWVVTWSRDQLLSFYLKVGFVVFGEAYQPKRIMDLHYPLILTWESFRWKHLAPDQNSFMIIDSLKDAA